MSPPRTVVSYRTDVHVSLLRSDITHSTDAQVPASYNGTYYYTSDMEQKAGKAQWSQEWYINWSKYNNTQQQTRQTSGNARDKGYNNHQVNNVTIDTYD
jgi:hypothetical protein